MGIRLYYASGACSFVPHAALETIAAATGERFEYVPVRLHKGEQRTPEYLALNPNGQVPLLMVDERPLPQIVAICDYLANRYPQVGLLPADPWLRAQQLSMLAWFNNSVHTTFTHFFMPAKFTADEAAQASIRSTAAAQYRGHLERIEGWLASSRPWLGGANPSFVDWYVLTLVRWGGFAGIDPATMPGCREYTERLARTPAVAAAMARERIELNTFKPVGA